MRTLDHSARPNRIMQASLLALLLGGLLAVFALPGHVEGQTAAGRFSDLGLMIRGGPQQSFGDRTITQGDFSVSADLLRLDDSRYSGGGLVVAYTWDDDLDFIGYMARLDFGVGEGEFHGRDPVWFHTYYMSIMAGYGSGSFWDLTYVERFDQEDRVEIDVSGVPLFASFGVRRIGRASFSLEATVGAILITSQTPYEMEGEAPSAIPSIGIKAGIGFDTFSYIR